MPASPYNVLINLTGSVNPSVNLAIRNVTRQLRGLQTQAIATNRTLSLMSKGFGAIMGIGGGLLAIGSLTAGMNEAIKLSKENEQIQEATLVILMNQRRLRHENIELASKDLEMLNAQAKALQQQTGLYKNIFERGSAILAQTHRTPAEIERINYSMANLAAYQRMQGMSVEKMPELWHAVGKAIETGMARNLNAIGVIMSPMDKTLLGMYAKTKNYAAAIKLVMGYIDRTYAGMAATRMRTLIGQTDRALANVKSAMESMGDALKPVQQRLTIIFGEMLPLIVPLVKQLANYINTALKNHMRDIQEWVDYVRKNAIPVMVSWIDKGWKVLIQAVKFFKENSSWLTPFLIGLATTIGVVTAAQWAWNIAMWANPIGVWTLAIGVLIGALAALIMNFDKVKKAALGFAEWMLGSDVMAKNKRRFHGGPFPGTTEGKFQEGVLPEFLRRAQKQVLRWIDELSVVFDNWWKILSDKFSEWLKLIQDKWDGFKGFLIKSFDSVVEGIKKVGQSVLDWLLTPIRSLNEAWQQFLQHLPFGPGPGVSTGARGNIDLSGNKSGVVYNPLPPAPGTPEPKGSGVGEGGISWIPPSKVWSFGIGEDVGVHPANYSKYGSGPVDRSGKHLMMPWDIAVSRNQLREFGGGPFHMGQWVNVIDRATGKVVWAHQKIADVSSWSKEIAARRGGQPFQSMEQRHTTKTEQFSKGLGIQAEAPVSSVDLAKKGRETVNRPADQASSSSSTPQHITLNYNVTHNHGDGGLGVAQLESVHRRHTDALSKIMEDAVYQNNRKSFDSGSKAL